MKWVLFLLMICIIVPGLHYTGFIVLFDDSSSENISNSTQEEDLKKSLSSKEKLNWSPISSPKWQAQSLSGEIFSLEKLRGQIIILNFWASWCLPCHKEFPELIETIKWAKGNVNLVAVSVDSSKKDIEGFLKRVKFESSKDYSNVSSKENKLNLPDKKDQNKGKQHIHIVWDPNYEIAKQFNVVKFPETFILNEDLKIVKKHAGELSFKEIKHFLEPFLTHREQSKN